MDKKQHKKRAGSLLSAILDLGKAMLVCGAEVWRVEETLGMLFETYCFKEHDVLIMSNSLQATVQTWDGRIYTQVRSVHGISRNLDKLEKLFLLSGEVCEEPLGVDTLRKRIYEIVDSPGVPLWKCFAGCIIGACGFCMLFNGDLLDLFATAVTSAAVFYISSSMMRHLSSTLTVNTFSAFAMELIIILLTKAGLAHDPGPISIAVIFTLISSLGIAAGFKDLFHGDALSGIIDTTFALLGAVGIAVGITMALLLFPGVHDSTEVQPLVSSRALQILYCTAGCSGFALLFGAKARTLAYSAAGAAATWIIFLFTFDGTMKGLYISSLAGAVFVALYSIVLENLRSIPAIVILTACIFPLLPGASLYFTVMGIIVHDLYLFRTQGLSLLLVCVGISAGFIIVDVLQKYLHYFEIKVAERRHGK